MSFILSHSNLLVKEDCRRKEGRTYIHEEPLLSFLVGKEVQDKISDILAIGVTNQWTEHVPEVNFAYLDLNHASPFEPSSVE